VICQSQASSGGGATEWLTTKAPLKPGEVMTIQFVIWDTSDAALDSAVLLDRWVWAPTPTSAGTDRPTR
jgi:hypothetical protein